MKHIYPNCIINYICVCAQNPIGTIKTDRAAFFTQVKKGNILALLHSYLQVSVTATEHSD